MSQLDSLTTQGLVGLRGFVEFGLESVPQLNEAIGGENGDQVGLVGRHAHIDHSGIIDGEVYSRNQIRTLESKTKRQI